jgi:hypothetical protein
MKICPVGAELSHDEGGTHGQTDRQMDRQTDMTNLIVSILNFSKASKKLNFSTTCVFVCCVILITSSN